MASLLIESGPGTGKTFTVSTVTMYLKSRNKQAFLDNARKLTDEQIEILKWCDQLNLEDKAKIIGMAYNAEAAKQLDKNTHKTVECRSVHGWGYKIIQRPRGYVKINNKRSITLVEQLTGRSFNSLPNSYQWRCTLRYFEKLKDEMLDPTEENVKSLANKYEDLAQFRFHPEMIEQIRKLIPLAKKIDPRVGIEYIDQVWLACFMLQTPMYDLAIVDECQDISPARRFLASHIAKHTIWIGDTYQAINAFAGADPYSMEEIKKTVTHELPLKTSFRCPVNVITKLNQLKPLAKLKGTNQNVGIEKRVALENIAQVMEENGSPESHLVICRTNAPLIRVAHKLIQSEIPCRMLSQRTIEGLCTLSQKARGTSMEEYEANLCKYQDNICRSLSDYIKELFKDKINCIRAVIPFCSTPEDVTKELRKLLKASNNKAVRLSTIHGAKGLEAPNVWILFPPIESPLARTPEQKQQESNLRYVAESRTSLNTFWVVD